MGLCSPLRGSGMSCLWWWFDWKYSCSNFINSVVLLIWFSKVMVSFMGPYVCLLFRMCNAYANYGSLCFILVYLICSWYLCLRLRLVCPKFVDSTFVLFLCIVDYFGFVSCCKVLLKDIPTFMCFNKWAIFIFLGGL
jgi:hypothetical protein